MFDPARLVFIDETAASTKMVRLRGRCPRSKRLVGSVPHGHWKTITLVAGLRHDGMVAPFVLDGHSMERSSAPTSKDVWPRRSTAVISSSWIIFKPIKSPA